MKPVPYPKELSELRHVAELQMRGAGYTDEAILQVRLHHRDYETAIAIARVELQTKGITK